MTSNEDIYEWLLQRDDKFLIDMQNLAFAQKKFGTGARGVVAKDIARQILREREQMRQYAVAVAQAQAKQPIPAPTQAPTPVIPTPTPSPMIIYTTKPAPQQILKVQQTVTPVVQKVTPVTPTPTPAPQQILYVSKPAIPKPSLRERIVGLFKRLKFW